MKRLVIFITVFAAVVFLVTCSKQFSVNPANIVVTPRKDAASQDAPQKDVDTTDFDDAEGLANIELGENEVVTAGSEGFTSFIPLMKEETLLSTLTCDFDGDNFDDQIIIVKNTSTARISIIIGLYNNTNNTYSRFGVISTNVAKVSTFSYQVLDMIGNHSSTLLYQGLLDDGTFILALYTCKKSDGKKTIVNIGSFTGDVSIQVQKTARAFEYESNMALGSSFPVEVLSLAPSANSSQNKIKTVYNWNFDKQQYIKISTTTITGKENSEASRSGAFADYIEGLWTQEGASSQPRYIFFDCKEREVILLTSDTQGVYAWEELGRTKNGAYLSCSSEIISSMKRRFDILINSQNEVGIKVHENVGMVINESNLWDGNYKRVAISEAMAAQDNAQHPQYEKALSLSKWVDGNGREFTFSNNEYTVSKITRGEAQKGAQQKASNNGGDDKQETIDKGLYILDTVGDFCVIQLRSNFDIAAKEGGKAVRDNSKGAKEITLEKAYAIQFETTRIATSQKSGEQRSVVNKDIIYFVPVATGPLTCSAIEGENFILRKKEELSDEERAKLQKVRLLRLIM